VNFGAVVVLGTFAVPATEHVALSFPLPNDPIVQGLPLTFQAFTPTPGVGFQFSTPVTPVMN
jgi:hypothetical protein